MTRHFNGLHVDIMDGHFCSNIALSPSFAAAIRDEWPGEIDVHLMVENPIDYLPELSSCGVDMITVHVESAARDVHRIIDRIRRLGIKAGIALCPTTPLTSIVSVLPLVDSVTILGVDPGFIGQEMLSTTPDRVRELAEISASVDGDRIVEIDGGVRTENLAVLATSGASQFVLGRGALFGRASILEVACATAVADFEVLAGGAGGHHSWQ